MVDIWMISTMMYPFSVVTLYSVLEGIKNDGLNIPETCLLIRKDHMSKRSARIINFLLDYGLPVLVTVSTRSLPLFLSFFSLRDNVGVWV